LCCASPACLAQHGAPLAIDDLLPQRLILQRDAVTPRLPCVEASQAPCIRSSLFTTKPDGLGMLLICRSIVQSHGGQLWVTANDPAGASFHFTLPAQRQASLPARS